MVKRSKKRWRKRYAQFQMPLAWKRDMIKWWKY